MINLHTTPLMNTNIDYNCYVHTQIFLTFLIFHDSRLISEGEKNQIVSTAKFQLFFLHHFRNTFFFPRASYFSVYFFIYFFLFRRVESEMWEREKSQQAHSKFYVYLYSTMPRKYNNNDKKGKEKKEFPDFIIIFQHLYFM